jgi:hypothetical protein
MSRTLFGPSGAADVRVTPSESERSVAGDRAADGSHSRLRCERPSTSSAPPSARYQVRAVESAVDVIDPVRAGATPVPMEAPAARPVDGTGREVADAHFAAARRLSALGRHRSAVLQAQKAMKLAAARPAEQALYAWLLYLRAGTGTHVHSHVWHHLDEALRADPNCAVAHRYRGVLLARTGQTALARSHLLRALQLDSGDAEAERELRKL